MPSSFRFARSSEKTSIPFSIDGESGISLQLNLKTAPSALALTRLVSLEFTRSLKTSMPSIRAKLAEAAAAKSRQLFLPVMLSKASSLPFVHSGPPSVSSQADTLIFAINHIFVPSTYV